MLAIFGHFYAKPLLAQVRAALVKNIDEPGRNPYHASGSCSDPTGNCDVVFPAIPAGKRAIIEYVSADLIASLGGLTPAAALTETPSGGDSIILPTFARFPGDFGVSERVVLYEEAGEQPKLHAANASVNSVTISGYLVDLTQ